MRCRSARLVVGLVLVLGLLSGCGGSDYCGAVKDHQARLTDVTSSGSPGALLQALPIFRDLSDRAPDDVSGDWQTFVKALTALDDAVRAAGLDPATYDDQHLPASLTATERGRIQDAAAVLAEPSVVQAFDSVQQEAKDVCHTPLTL